MDYTGLGFHRVAAASPPLTLGDPAANAHTTLAWARRAAESGACLILFPELGLTGHSCEDLFQSAELLQHTRQALGWLARESADLPAIVVGAPYRTPDGRLYDTAFVLHGGGIRGAVPKTYLVNYGEYYEKRWFVSGSGAIDFAEGFPFTTHQLFRMGELIFAVEICEDLWAPVPPSCQHALAGAAVILNLSASNDWVTKADYRRELVRQQSARLNAGYVYVSSGPTESSKDLVYGGHAMIAENGELLAEGERLRLDGSMIAADLDVDRLLHERSRNMTFGESRGENYRLTVLGPPPPLESLQRRIEPLPFVPPAPAHVSDRAREILHLQVTGLARRLGGARPVLGVSGGLDSTLALLVCGEAMDRLGRAQDQVLAVSMPGPGTTDRTRRSAADLARALGAEFREIPIGAAVDQHFRDIDHDPDDHDVVFENAQARERTQILFDLANKLGGIVVGTGDLSELALGFCTYNADHMAGYAVNLSVPKTLVKHVVRWYRDRVADEATSEVLAAILETTISPELLPPVLGEPQSTEAAIGPYVLHDFFLFHHVRNGFSPAKIHALSRLAFPDRPEDDIKRWMKVFFQRFYTQQFKRTTLPAGPKVGSVTLSPRGDLRMPDEVSPRRLLEEIDAL
jgi:NAD+ synthase (glutamine-hydrolysing)